ncbi:MAG: hypothetical protein NTY94_01735 [Alphaproteobacteria bacterium]|nr:hypothetical protein [Alphaproteobacteria bacterium]
MSPLHERLSWLLATLGAALGAVARRLATPPQPAFIGHHTYVPITEPERLPPLSPAQWQLFWNRTGRALRRVAVLYQAWIAGTLQPPRPHARTTREATPQPRPSPLRLPRGFAWLNHRAPEIVPAAGMLDILVQEPELRRFATEVPRAARLLRPLCHALGIGPPPELRLPPRPRKPRPPRPPTSRRPSPNDPSLMFRDWERPFIRGIWKKHGRD